MKEQAEIYAALEAAGKIFDKGIDLDMTNLSGDIMVIKETATEAAMNEDFVPTALAVIRKFAQMADEDADSIDAAITDVRHKIAEGLQEPEAVRASDPYEEENKSYICRQLSNLVRETRAGSDVLGITLQADQKTAVITYRTGARKEVNVECDSGIALIIDICRALM